MKLDPVLENLFEFQDVAEGDESMAVKPWMG